MTEIRKELDEAYKLISVVQVSGDAVDIIATVRARLRKAYELAAEPETEEAGDG